MKKIYCLLFSVLISILAFSQRPLILKYNGFLSVYLETNSSFHYEYEKIGNPAIKGQGEGNNGITTITLPTLFEDYLIKIYPSGKFKIQFPTMENASRFQEVVQWGDIQWDNDLSYMFSNCSNLNFTATDKPDFSNVTNMTYMFAGATNFNSSINNWDVSKVTNMNGVFIDAQNFNQPLDNWNVGKVERTDEMFMGATAFNQNINSWNVSNVKHMESMFMKAHSFNQPLNNWNVGNLEYAVFTFAEATSFNQPLNSWNVSKVESLYGIFRDATSFNQPLDSWNITNNKVLNNAFNNAASFNQSLASWNIQNVQDGGISDFLSDSGIDCDNYGKSLKGWAENINTTNNMYFSSKNIKYNKFGEIYREQLKDKGWSFEQNTDILDENCGTYLSYNEIAKTTTAIYPNPTSNWINLRSDKKIDALEILTTLGEIILKTDKEKISLQNVPSGVYMIKVIYKDGTNSVQKVIKK